MQKKSVVLDYVWPVRNTGFATIGIHPHSNIIKLRNCCRHTNKIDAPGKASTIALVDSIEPPIVKLNDGSVMKIEH